MDQISLFIFFLFLFFVIHIFLINNYTQTNKKNTNKKHKYSKKTENFDNYQNSILSNNLIPKPIPTYASPLINLQPLISLQQFNTPPQFLQLLNVINKTNIIFELDLSTNKIPLTDNTGNYSLIPYCSSNVITTININSGNNISSSDPRYGVTVFNDPMFGYVLDIDNFGGTISSLLTNFSPGKLGIKTYTLMYWLWLPNVNAANNNGYTIASNQWNMSYTGPWLQYNNSSGQRVVNQTIPMNWATWTHICVTFDGTTTSYYINSTLSDSNTNQNVFDISPISFAGAWDGTNVKYNGNKDMKRRFANIKFLNVGLTQNEVSQIYFNELLRVKNVSILTNSDYNLYSNYFNLYIQSQNAIDRTTPIDNMINEYTKCYQDISGLIMNISNLYEKMSNNTYVTTPNTNLKSHIPYLTPAVIQNCGGFKLNSCQLNAYCMYNGKGGWINSVQNVCSLTTPVTVTWIRGDHSQKYDPGK